MTHKLKSSMLGKYLLFERSFLLKKFKSSILKAMFSFGLGLLVDFANIMCLEIWNVLAVVKVLI